MAIVLTPLIAEIAAQNALARANGYTAILGDSIMNACNPLGISVAHPCVNLAVPGAYAADVLTQQLPALFSIMMPDLKGVIVMIGTNDRIPIMGGSETIAGFQSICAQIVAYLKTYLAASRIQIMAPPPTGNASEDATMQSIAAAWAAACAGTGVIFIPLAPLMSVSGSNPPTMDPANVYAGGPHWSTAGWHAVYQTIGAAPATW